MLRKDVNNQNDQRMTVSNEKLKFLTFFPKIQKKIVFFLFVFQHFSHLNGTNETQKSLLQSLHSSLSRLCDVMVEVFVIVVQNDCKESFTERQQQQACSRYMVVVFVPQSFCDVVVIFFYSSHSKRLQRVVSQNANKRPQQNLASVF